jgi:hypothetical protein
MSSPTPDLYCDPETGDLDITELGQGRLTGTLLEEVGQRLRTKLQHFLGEWFLDQNLGLPYYRDVLVRNPNLSVIKALFQDVISSDRGVEQLTLLDLALDSETRVLSVSFEAVLNSSELLSSGVTQTV